MTTKTNRAIGTAVLSAALIACGGVSNERKSTNTSTSSSALTGRVNDTNAPTGSSPYDSGGTLALTNSISVSSIASDGSLTTLASGNVDASGRYTLKVPAGQERLIMAALDSSGRALASAIVESSGSAGSTTTVVPITTRSSLQAQVFLQMAAHGIAPASVDVIDLAERIDLRTANAIRVNAEANQAVGAELSAMADAMATAQAAMIQSYAKSGVTVTTESLFQAKLAAAQAMDARLDAGDGASLTSDESLRTDVTSALTKLGLDATAMAKAATTSSVGLRGTLSAELTSAASDQAVLDAASVAEASLEADTSANAAASILAAGGASNTIVEATVAIGQALSSDIAAATTASTAASAFVAFQEEIADRAQATWQTTILGQVISGQVQSSTQAQADFEAILQGEATAQAALQSSVKAAFPTIGAVEANAAAQTIVNAYATYDAMVDAQARQSITATAQADLAANLLATANGSFLATK